MRGQANARTDTCAPLEILPLRLSSFLTHECMQVRDEARALAEADAAIQLQARDAEIANLNEQLKKLNDALLRELHSSQKDKRSEISKLERRAEILMEESSAASRIVAEKDAKIVTLIEELADSERAVHDLTFSLSALNRLNDASKNALAAAKENSKEAIACKVSEVKAAENVSKDLRVRVNSLLEYCNKAANDLAAKMAEADLLQCQCAKLQEDLEAAQKMCAEVRESQRDTVEQLRLQEERISEVEQSGAEQLKIVRDAFEATVAEKEADVERMKLKIAQMEETCANAEAGIEIQLAEKVRDS